MRSPDSALPARHWGRWLAVSLVLALPLTAGLRFIVHTDREYSGWITVFGASARLLATRCAEQKTSTACAAAGTRSAMVSELRNYRDNVTAWWWPTLAATLLAWMGALVSCAGFARERIRQRRR